MKSNLTASSFKGLVFILVLIFTTSCAKKINIVNKGASEYHIILPSKAQMSELKAASLIQRHLQSVTGLKLPIMRDREQISEFEICLGITNRDESALSVMENMPERDGYRILTNGNKIFIYGGSPDGTLNGVTSFLEDYIGVRVYSSAVTLLPEHRKIRIEKDIDTLYNPPIKFRTTHYRDTWNPAYANWHKLHHNKDGSHPNWGYWVHTFNTLVPPGQYYEDHPEYYAEINGSRVPTQLCLTNPDVYDIALMNLKKAMEEQPDKTYWSVSQNDNVSYCQCENCRKIDEAEGTPMGSILSFVNRMASEFPDKVISTLAYQYSRKAPENMKPAPNVNIMLCTIELNRSRPIATDPSSESFRKDIEDWAKITKDIVLWDYVIQFENLVSPFPNLRVLQPNIQYLVENNADKHFQQGNREIGGEFAELRAYMISKLLWDPYTDIDAVMDDFLEGYYGEAGKYIRRYIDDIHDELEASGQGLNIFGHPSDGALSWLRPEKMKDYEKYFDRAEKAVEDDPEILERVRIARMPLEYAKIEIAIRLGTSEGGMYERDADGRWKVKEFIPETAKSLVARANHQGVTRFKEWHTTPTEYLESLERTWEVDMFDHLAYDKAVALEIPASKKYSLGNEKMLTDGLRGPQLSYAYNWLGFEGSECIATIDLEEITEIESISSSWQQNERSWVFYPDTVNYYGSAVGESWALLGQVPNAEGHRNNAVEVQDFELNFEETQTIRYIRCETKSLIDCPEWHPGSGSPAWIFIDEITVK